MDTTALNINRLIEYREKLGISKQVIYHMADVLGTSAEYLLGYTDNPSKTRYVVDAESNADLFEIVKFYDNADETTRNRLIAYVKKFEGYCE